MQEDDDVRSATILFRLIDPADVVVDITDQNKLLSHLLQTTTQSQAQQKKNKTEMDASTFKYLVETQE